MSWNNPDRIHPGVFGHPALIIARVGAYVRFVLVTSHSGQNFRKLSYYKQLQHLPIAPSPAAESGEQLQMRVGKTRSPSYIKAHESWWLPTSIISRANVDEKSGKQLLIEKASFDYVWQLVREYEGTGSRDWPRHKSSRPFPGYPPEVFPHGYPPESSPSSKSGTPESQRSCVDSLSSIATEVSTADNTPPKSLLPDSGLAEKNGRPSDQSDKASQSLPAVASQPPPQGQLPPDPRPETSDIRGKGWPPLRNDGSTPWHNPWRRPEQSYDPHRPTAHIAHGRADLQELSTNIRSPDSGPYNKKVKRM